MLGGDIKVVMTLDDGDFTVKTIKAGRTVQELKRSIDQTAKSTQALEHHFTGLGGRFRSIVQTASLLRYAMHDVHDIFMALPGAILKTSGEVEKLTKLMEGMSKETTQAARQAEALSNVKFVFDLAQRAPFEVKTLTDAFVKLKAGGLDPTNGSMQALVDSVARFGGSSEAMHRASIAIQQMAGKGVISMEELRQQLGEAVPNAINMMAQGAGMSMPKFAKLVSTGTVEATQALNNMFAVMRFQNDGAAEAMMNSWTGMLALLKTKFDLFKLEAGKSQFFEESKNQLQDLIDMFGTAQAKRFANDLGEGLAQLVRVLRSAVELMIQWSDSIKLAGQAFIAYFVVNRALEAFKAIRGSIDGLVQKYQDDINAKRKALIDKQTLIGNEIAAEEAAFARKQALWAREQAALEKQDASERAAAIKKMELERKKTADEIAARVARYNELNRLQQQFLGQQMAAELAAEAAMRQKKAGSSATARAYQSEADRLGNNASIVGNNVSTIQAEIDALKRREAALLASINATRTSNMVSAQSNAIAAESASHARTIAGLMSQKAQAAIGAANGIGMMTRVMAGAKVIFDAFGGWVGLAIGVLVTLGQKLWEYMNRWEEFKKIVDRTKQGIASTEDMESAKARADEAAKSVKTLQTILEQLDKDGASAPRSISRALGAGFRDNRGGADVAAYRASIEAQLKEKKGIYEQATTQFSEQKRLLDEDAASKDLSQYQRTFRRETQGRVDELRNQSAELDKAEKDAIDAASRRAEASGRKITESEREAIAKQFIDKRNALVKAREQYLLDFALGKKREIDEAIAAAKDPRQKQVLEAQRQFVNDQIRAASDALKAAGNLGRIGIAAKDPKKPLKESPIIRLAEQLEGEVAAAKAKLAATLSDARDLNSLKQQVMFEALGDLAAGKFDERVQNAEGEMVPTRMGGEKERKEFVNRFRAFIAEGKTDINAFIDSLATLKEKAQFKDIVSKMIDKKSVDDSINALNAIKQVGIDTSDALTRSAEEFVNRGLVKENSFLDETIKRVKKLEATVTQGTEAYRMFTAMRDKALVDANQVDINKMGVDSANILREAQRNALKATMSNVELRKYEYDEEIKRIEALKNRREEETFNLLATTSMTTEQFLQQMSIIDTSTQEMRQAALLNFQTNSRTQLQMLADEWSKATQAMDGATARWASSFTDRLVDMLAGGSFKFKEFAAGIARDMLGIVIKKGFGDMITSAFGSFGGKMTEMLGLGGSAAGAAGQATQTAAVTTAMTTMTGATTAAMTAVATDMTVGMTTMTTEHTVALTTMTTETSIAMTTMALETSAAMAAIASSAGASLFGFADGGVMTSAGPLPLKAYANGGIANSPQLALFGEGRMPEAYVPLPDGRSIPVTMSGMGGGSNAIINITINNDGSGSSDAQGDNVETWREMAQRVRGVVMEELVSQQRPGGVLYR